jgi:hypothetical protein
MGSRYEWGRQNPFQDILVKAMLLHADVADEKSKGGVTDAFSFILRNFLENEGDIVYLNFEITDEDGYVKVTGNNSVTALWLSGIIPDDTAAILEHNRIIIGDRKYVYNTKTKKLTCSIAKN